jgi:hypothetical protein
MRLAKSIFSLWGALPFQMSLQSEKEPIRDGNKPYAEKIMDKLVLLITEDHFKSTKF